MSNFTFSFLLAIPGLLVYMVPSIVASLREHNNGRAIGALNIFLGWTFIGWVAALIWALTGESG